MVLLSFPMLASAPDSGNGAPMVIVEGKVVAVLVEVVLEVVGVTVTVAVEVEVDVEVTAGFDCEAMYATAPPAATTTTAAPMATFPVVVNAVRLLTFLLSTPKSLFSSSIFLTSFWRFFFSEEVLN